jgi:23S rRNA pseudouridine1911/1915/1917 synthase
VRLIETHLVPGDAPRLRLSDYLPGRLQFLLSRKSIKKAIKQGVVLVDGRTGHTGDWVLPGQLINVYSPDTSPPRPLDIDVVIVYEDDYLLAINKPAGLTVSGNKYHTVVNAIQGKSQMSDQPDALPWPHPVHRLDAATSGLLLLAKTQGAQIGLGLLFEIRQIKKTYQAIVCGKAPAEGIIEQELDAKSALTSFQKLQEVPSLKTGFLSLLELFPQSGRTHQLRRHLSGIGLPILGDKLYTPDDRPLLKHKGLFLCAVKLEFIHPMLKTPLAIETSAPDKFGIIMKRSMLRWKKFNRTP